MPLITIWRTLRCIPHSFEDLAKWILLTNMYEDTRDFIQRCGSYQRHGNINSRDAMPLTNNLQIELFDVWGIDYMGPFPKSKGYEYILVVVDYVSKWVEAMPCRAANAKNSKKMFEETIFPRFGVQGW